MNLLLALALIGAEFKPANGAQLVAAVAQAKKSPGPDRITLTPRTVYTVAVNPDYRVALILDGIAGLTIESPAATKRSDWPTIKLAAQAQYGKAIVLLGSGRTAGSSAIAIRRVVLDGADSETPDEDTQQSALFRAFSVVGLELTDVELRNVAADGIKLSGTTKYGATSGVRLTRVWASDCGRGALVFQSLVRDVQVRQLNTVRMRKGAIDVEATLVGAAGPTDVRILDSDLQSLRADGTVPDYGLSLGGSDTGLGLMRDVLIARVTSNAGIWIRNAADLEFVDVVVGKAPSALLIDPPAVPTARYGLQLDKVVHNLSWTGGSISGRLGAVLSTHHGTVGAIPDGVRFVDVALDSPPGTKTVEIVSGTRHEFERVSWGSSNLLRLYNELADQPMRDFVIRGLAPKIIVSYRPDRPTSPIESVEVYP